MKKGKKPLALVGLFQALGVTGYCALVGLIFWRGNQWFGPGPNYLGPVMVLLLFSASALICALIVFAYPVIFFWQKKQAKKAIRLVIYTAAWLALIVLLFLLTVVVCRNFC